MSCQRMKISKVGGGGGAVELRREKWGRYNRIESKMKKYLYKDKER